MMTSTTISSISVKPRGRAAGRRAVESGMETDSLQGVATGRPMIIGAMAQRLSAFVIWAAAAACAVFWVLRLGVAPAAVPAGAALAQDAPAPRADLARLLGAPQALAASPAAEPPPVAESARFRLLGVIAGGRKAGGGVALLVVDGKPPRAYRVGASIDAGLMVQSVTRRGVAIGPPGAPTSVRLELPRAAGARHRPAAAPGARRQRHRRQRRQRACRSCPRRRACPAFPWPGTPVMPMPPPPEVLPPDPEPANR